MLGFIRGVILGGLVAGAGLVALSQFAPPPAKPAQAPQAETGAEVASASTAQPEPQTSTAQAPAATPKATETDDPLLSPSSAVETLPAEQATPEPAATAPPQETVPLPQISPDAGKPEPETLAPVEPPAAPPAAPLPEKTGPVANAPAMLGTPPVGLDGSADKVVVGRLPTIAPPSLTPEAVANPATPGAAADPAGDTLALPETAPAETAPADTRPIALYASASTVTPNKPLFSILLEDTGEDVDRRALADAGLPLGIVIDPLAEKAAERAAEWRSYGVEVILSAASLPKGATPADIEQNLQVMADKLPETVALMDVSGTAFQNNRQLATQVVEVLAAQGRGVITLDQGVNSADQVAQRSGLEAAVVFRRFDVDADGQPVAGPAAKRALDRAVSKTAVEGAVVVLGTLRADTISGLLEWAIEGRAATVAIAPVTKVMAVQ